uniref:F-box domain-containing protein n=1 Tax=Oryza punctata TaxID=4537 RepID=A0A0E0KS30_ORYPU
MTRHAAAATHPVLGDPVKSLYLAGAGNEQQPRDTMMLIDLPDDVLLVILNKLDTGGREMQHPLEAVWSRVPGMLPNIELDVDSFAPPTRRRLHFQAIRGREEQPRDAHESRHDIHRLVLSFFSRDESVRVVRAVDDAMARGRKIHDMRFTVSSEKHELLTEPSLRKERASYVSYRYKFPRVFASLTRLDVECVKLDTSRSRVSGVLDGCKKLADLSLVYCDFAGETVVAIEHERLAKMKLDNCICDTVELRRLPRLRKLEFGCWDTRSERYPVVFGHVPRLRVLMLASAGTANCKALELSRLLQNTSLRELWLNFETAKIWIKPENPKLVVPVTRSLMSVHLDDIHPDYGITWTLMLSVTVTDHRCVPFQNEMFSRNKNEINRETSDFKHCNLAGLTIYGFKAENKFIEYIKRVMKTAVHLEYISLHDFSCELCNSNSFTRYVKTKEERDSERNQQRKMVPYQKHPIFLDLSN